MRPLRCRGRCMRFHLMAWTIVVFQALVACGGKTEDVPSAPSDHPTPPSPIASPPVNDTPAPAQTTPTPSKRMTTDLTDARAASMCAALASAPAGSVEAGPYFSVE